MTSEKKKRRAALSNTKNYRPTDKEPFMNERQREYFRNKLLASKEDILRARPVISESVWAILLAGIPLRAGFV
jgi:hypothetical protein